MVTPAAGLIKHVILYSTKYAMWNENVEVVHAHGQRVQLWH